MELNNLNSKHLNRRKAGRFSPLSARGYTLHINNATLSIEKLTDIGAEGFKIVHRAFKDFDPRKEHQITFKRHGKVLFACKAKVSWIRKFKHPLNTTLVGFQFIDEDLKVAEYWVQNGYRGRSFELKEKNDYSPVLRFHNLVTNSEAIKRYENLKRQVVGYLPHVGVPVILAVLFISAIW